MEDGTLEPQYEALLKVCLALDENCPRFDKRWCDQSAYVNPITRKHDNYLKRLNRLLTDKCYLAKYCVTYLSLRSARNTMGTRGAPE